MAIIALHSASTGLSALNTELDVIANNLANSNTQAFKSSRTNFQDLLYEERAQPGVENANGDQRPTGLYVGLGTKVSGTIIDWSQGSLLPTDHDLDIAIEGRGFFQVQIEDDIDEGVAYTRAGNFTLNSDGEIVLATSEGRRLEPPITVPMGTHIDIRSDGTVWYTDEQSQPQEAGQIELAQFINPSGLRNLGENLYLPSESSGDAELGAPIEGGRGRLQSGFLEASNVDPVKELVRLIQTQRAFELNSQSIQAADEILQQVGRLRRF